MFRFLQRFGRDRQARRRGTGPLTRVRRRNHQLNCEALESRQLLSGYYVVNESSGKVLDDPNFSTSNGAVIQQFQRVRSRQCQGFPRNPGRFHPGSGLSPSLDQLGAIEREASFFVK